MLEPRTLVIAVIVGVGVTLLAALVPAIRATRVAPVAARVDGAAASIAAFAKSGGDDLGADVGRRRRPGGTGTVRVGARDCSARGDGRRRGGDLRRDRPHRALRREAARDRGRLSNRVAFHTPGRLARENAVRNPGRTALTSAALMVGLGLVVFVAVFAAGLKSSFARQIDELVKAEIFVYGGQGLTPIPERVQGVVEDVRGRPPAGREPVRPSRGRRGASNIAYDVLIGTDTQELDRVYTFDWIEGGDSLVEALGPGTC